MIGRNKKNLLTAQINSQNSHCLRLVESVSCTRQRQKGL